MSTFVRLLRLNLVYKMTDPIYNWVEIPVIGHLGRSGLMGINISTVKKCGHSCKNHVSVAMCILFGPSSSSGNEKILEFSVSNLHAGSSNSVPHLTTFEIVKYNKDNFLRILKTILEAWLSPACGQDWKIFEDLSKQVFQPKVSNICKGKLHIDCYNFIWWYKDYFAICRSWSWNQVFFTAKLLNKRLVNRWQQYKWNIWAEILVLSTWAELTTFLQKRLGETQVFVDDI